MPPAGGEREQHRQTGEYRQGSPATKTGECRRGSEPSRLLRFLVTRPQNSSASEPMPASPASVNNTLRTTDAGPRRS